MGAYRETLVVERFLFEAFCALFLVADVSLRNIRSNSSGYPGQSRPDFLQLPHPGPRPSSHCSVG